MRMRSKPRRAGACWMEDAPDWVLSVSDNKGKSADRYTIWLQPFWSESVRPAQWYVPYLAVSDNPESPVGVSLFGELPQYEAAWRSRDRIRWLDLPEHIRAHVIRRWTDAEKENEGR
jgi:hypothetical protein